MVTMPLQRLIVERLAELGRTYREAEQVAGGLVSRATLNNIATGQHVGHIREDTLRGIALALDLPYRKIRPDATRSRMRRSESRSTLTASLTV